MHSVYFICIIFTQGSRYLGINATLTQQNFHNSSTTERSVSSGKSQTTAFSEHQTSVSVDVGNLDSTTMLGHFKILILGDGDNLNATSKRVGNDLYSSTYKTNHVLTDITSPRTIELSAKETLGTSVSDLVIFGTTGRQLGGGSQTTSIRPYIEQIGPASFRVHIQVCHDSPINESISANEGEVEVVLADRKSDLLRCAWTIVAPDGKFVNIMFDRFYLGNSSVCGGNNNILEIFDSKGMNMRAYGCGVSGPLPMICYSVSNRLVFQFTYCVRSTSMNDHLDIKFRFNATSENLIRNLLVVNTSPTSGYVASPGFDVKKVYPNNFNNYVILTPPLRHTVMISFTRLNVDRNKVCSRDYLRLLQVSTNGETEIWKKCGSENVLPRVYNSSLRLQFVTDASVVKTGFKMLFSFHPYLETPIELDAGVFNCSVPYYDTFKDHMYCNLDRECQGGEDEVSCSYVSQSCGAGFIDAGTECYTLENQTKNVTWNEALFHCEQLDQQLVTMKTQQEWRNFQRILSFGRRAVNIYIGLYTTVPRLHLMYSGVLQWVDETMAYYVQLEDLDSRSGLSPMCLFIDAENTLVLSFVKCDVTNPAKFMCEFPKTNVSVIPQASPTYPVIIANNTPDSVQNVSFVKCSGRHVSIDFLSCAKESNCDVKRDISFCELPGKGSLPMFKCDDNVQTIPYTLVCDYKPDCVDSSDENFCMIPECTKFLCRNQQCISFDQRCDGIQDCRDSSDESCGIGVEKFISTITSPAIVHLAEVGNFTITPINASEPCPDTHFRCASNDYCLPVFVRCNGVYDCLDKQDETNCQTYTCPGLYRCYSSSVCLHPSHVCDGVFQCPQQDDERFCQLTCPTDSCTCQGHAFVCFRSLNVTEYPDIRYLDASGTGLTYHSVENNVNLVSLILRSCGLRALSNFNLPNLQILNLEHNLLTSIEMSIVLGLTNLRYLILSGNPLISLIRTYMTTLHRNLIHLDMSFSTLETYDDERLQNFQHIKYLNLSYSPIKILVGNAFSTTPMIQTLDLRGCPIESFSESVLKDLKSLLTMYSENYKLCCQAILPEHLSVGSCFTTIDEISSCEDLLESTVFRIFLWGFCLLALVGNAGSFVSRFCLNNQASYSVFVLNLNIADFVMGIYLGIIGVADQVYRGKYLWHDTIWKTSSVCHVAGFLCLLSTEVSAFTVCLITLDRFLVLRFPFSRVRFKKHSAAVACGSAWVVGLVLAAVPLLPVTSHWEFYSQTGICVPLPITRKSFGGHNYSFSIVIVLNFVIFVFIAVGQLIIYYSVRTNSLSTSSNKNTADLVVARRLASVALSNFLCFFPVVFLGLLAASGTPIPTEVSVAIVIFVLPLNASLNPFVYTFNTVMEKRRRAREMRLLKRLEAQMRIQVFFLQGARQVKGMDTMVTKELVLKQMKVWIDDKIVTVDEVIMHVMTFLNKKTQVVPFTGYRD